MLDKNMESLKLKSEFKAGIINELSPRMNQDVLARVLVSIDEAAAGFRFEKRNIENIEEV